MSRRGLGWLALLGLFALHQDLWLWNDGELLFGLPVGLTYHLAYCLAAGLLMTWLVRERTRDEGPE